MLVDDVQAGNRVEKPVHAERAGEQLLCRRLRLEGVQHLDVLEIFKLST